MSSPAINYNSPADLRKAGFDALTKELGPLGMVLFMRQFDSGYGDYTAERDELLKDLVLEDVENELYALSSKHSEKNQERLNRSIADSDS
jgi:hypothetical protein